MQIRADGPETACSAFWLDAIRVRTAPRRGQELEVVLLGVVVGRWDAQVGAHREAFFVARGRGTIASSSQIGSLPRAPSRRRPGPRTVGARQPKPISMPYDFRNRSAFDLATGRSGSRSRRKSSVPGARPWGTRSAGVSIEQETRAPARSGQGSSNSGVPWSCTLDENR